MGFITFFCKKITDFIRQFFKISLFLLSKKIFFKFLEIFLKFLQEIVKFSSILYIEDSKNHLN